MWGIVGQVLMLAYLPGCAYLGAARGTVGVAWALLVPWGLFSFDLVGGDTTGEDTVALGSLAFSAVGFLVCLAGQLWWRRRRGV